MTTPHKLYALLDPARFERVDVRFHEGGRTYSYLADAGKYKAGDRVVVPSGSDLAVPTVAAVSPLAPTDMQVEFEYRWVRCPAAKDHAHEEMAADLFKAPTTLAEMQRGAMAVLGMTPEIAADLLSLGSFNTENHETGMAVLARMRACLQMLQDGCSLGRVYTHAIGLFATDSVRAFFDARPVASHRLQSALQALRADDSVGNRADANEKLSQVVRLLSERYWPVADAPVPAAPAAGSDADIESYVALLDETDAALCRALARVATRSSRELLQDLIGDGWVDAINDECLTDCVTAAVSARGAVAARVTDARSRLAYLRLDAVTPARPITTDSTKLLDELRTCERWIGDNGPHGPNVHAMLLGILLNNAYLRNAECSNLAGILRSTLRADVTTDVATKHLRTAIAVTEKLATSHLCTLAGRWLSQDRNRTKVLSRVILHPILDESEPIAMGRVVQAIQDDLIQSAIEILNSIAKGTAITAKDLAKGYENA